MSDGSLSQDEIDALLQGSDDIGGDDLSENGNGGSSSALAQGEVSALLDLINSASANIGGSLTAMIGKQISISNPRIETIDANGLKNQLNDEVVEVRMDYESGIVGEHYYILDTDLAQIIGGLMMGQEGNELTEASLSAVSEAMNVISGNSSNTIGTKIKKELKPAPPSINKITKDAISLNPQTEYVKIIYDFTVEGYPPSTLIEIFSLNVIKEITSILLPASNAPVAAKMSAQPQQQGGMMNMGMPQMQQQQQQMQPGMQPYMQQQMPPGMMGMGGYMPQQQQIQNVQFSNLTQPPFDTSTAGNINLLMDVNMEMTVELGRTKKSIKDILSMGEGTVIELDKLAGEPVDVLVNGKLIAKGEVVVIDENFGVRVTEIVNPLDRISDLT
ncbi:MAG: flagellar motor switch phosphatase FliY [Spirochaetes bacterium]|jgi:flagellar motor switch protein FliN/FliY|nr:flagellar motor switch phosphatase FliY [Spirochaetota bacterium]